MRVSIIAICEKLPAWVEAGFDDYAARLRHVMPIKCTDLALGARGKNADLKRALADEGARMSAAVAKSSSVIALDDRGREFSSEDLATQLLKWRESASDLTFLIGGPDGLAENCLARATLKMSLGPMTLPHALVRIVLAEQLFRAHCILSNHPYHRAGKV
jgi:23S rRNA (pseudouridine1915-N3)-methyltransferase